MDPNQNQTPAPVPDAQPPAAPDNNQPAAPNTDDWSAAVKDFVTEKGSKITIPGEGEKVEDPNKPAPVGDKPDAGTGSDGDQGTKSETPPANDDDNQQSQTESAVRDARQVQREIKEDREAVLADVRKELFSDIPEQLEDADGDPIRTIEDVEKRLNPRTGKNFTEDEAGVWLLAATQHLAKQREDATKEADRITEVNLTIKDQADAIRQKYGEVLKANPNNIRETLAAAFNRTLVLKNDIIVDTPVSLKELYETALAPYAAVAEQLAASTAAAAEAKKEVVKVQDRSDRQDIYGGGNSNVEDPEEAGWSRAAKELYEN